MSDQQVAAAEATDSTTTGTDFDFDAWLGEQPEHVKKGYEGKTSGLHSALESERTQRKQLASDLKKLSGAAEKGSEAQKALDEMSTRLEKAERKADFYREAGRPEIGCADVDTAFLVAEAKGLFRRSGEPDWAALKAEHPLLFARKVAAGNAGTGTQSTPVTEGGMNQFIRAAAGRG